METATSSGEGSSQQTDYMIPQIEIKLEEAEVEPFNTMDFLELADVENNLEPIDYDSRDAIENPKTGQMVCLHCLEQLDKNHLNDHMRSIHNYRRVNFKCCICNVIYKDRADLIEHRRDCRPPVKKKVRKTINQLLKEIEPIMAEDFIESAACPVCMVNLSKSELKDHILLAHNHPKPTPPPPQASKCEQCHRIFKSKLTLKEHIKLVHLAVEDSVECELCGQKFRSTKYLSNHKRNVHPIGDKEYKCEFCGKLFKSRLCVHQHTKYVHPPESSRVECELCSKEFKSKLNLHQHLRVSHGIHGSKANYVEKLFCNNSELTDQDSFQE